MESGRESVTESKRESGTFEAYAIEVPAKVIEPDGFVPIKMVDPYHSYVIIDPPGDVLSPYALDFWGTDQGGLLLVCPTKGTGEVRILLPLGVAAGEYGFTGHFFNFWDNSPLFRVSGKFTVAEGPKTDCGHYTLRNVPNPERVDPSERLAVCAECPANDNGVCLECGCVLENKASQRGETCPLGKWPSVGLLEVPEVPKKKGKKS